MKRTDVPVTRHPTTNGSHRWKLGWRAFGQGDKPLGGVVIRVEIVGTIQLPLDEAGTIQHHCQLGGMNVSKGECRPAPVYYPFDVNRVCLLYTSPSPRDGLLSRMPSSA